MGLGVWRGWRMKYGQFLLVVFAALLLLFPMVKARADNGTPNDLEQAIKALRSADPAVAEKAAEALGRMRDPRAIGPLIAAVRDGSMDLCKAAARALKEIDDPGALEPLVIAGLASSAKAIQPLCASDRRLRYYKTTAPSIACVPALRDHDEKIRRNAAYILGRLSDPRAIEPLSIALLKDDNPQVRSTIAVAFGRSRDRRAVEPLLVALRDSQVAPDAARSLGLIGDPIAIPALIAALRTAETEYVQGCVAGALGRIGDPVQRSPSSMLSSRAKNQSSSILQTELSRASRVLPSTRFLLGSPGNGIWTRSVSSARCLSHEESRRICLWKRFAR